MPSCVSATAVLAEHGQDSEDPVTVAELAGHARLETLKVYGRLTDADSTSSCVT
jgi:hypothetical protein